MLSLLHAARRSRPCQTPLQGMKALRELVDDVGEDVVNICQVRVLQLMGKFVLTLSGTWG